MKNIQDAPIKKGTKVLVRLDLDVPIVNKKIVEPYRLEAGLQTLKYIIEKGGIPIILGHMGQPKGQVILDLSTKQLIPYFEQNLGKDKFEILENLRFNPGEEENSTEFVKKIINEDANGAEIYINESFATCHRKHASIVGIPAILPGYAGFRLQKEITILQKLKSAPKRPFVVIVGGAKLESKLPVIDAFIKTADAVLLGGKLGIEWDNQNKDIPDNLYIPSDYASEKKDIGPNTINKFEEVINSANTVLWAGPMGMYEDSKYILGTQKIANAVTNKERWSIIGGGDTIAAVNSIGVLNKFSFVSTGGGAMLEYLANDTLPGIEVLCL